MSNNILHFRRILNPASKKIYKTEDFLLNFLIKFQSNRFQKNKFNETPLIYFKPYCRNNAIIKELQFLQYHLEFFNKNYYLLAYGNNLQENEIQFSKDFINKNNLINNKNINKLNNIMIRLWFHEDINNNIYILALLENCNTDDFSHNKYINFVNNNYWFPNLEFIYKKKNRINDYLIQVVNYDKHKINIY